ncbi:putative odorant receptor 59c [Drosophila takahashii]|uniref:putative odorant receptor 59c n=1 Tax=Drosophila takahashii TaxID=29030 RepID=UPI001CF86427|nr:putative odorant receptor 59c [Drosophila takahashii]
MKKPLFQRLQTAPLDGKISSLAASDYFYRIAFALGWTPPKKGLLRWIYCLWTVTTMWLGIVYLPLGLTLTYVKHFDRFSPTEFLASLQVDINCIGNVIKSCVTFTQMWRFRRMNELISSLDERCVSPSQRQIHHKMVARVNLIVILFLSTYLGFCLLTLFTSVLAGKAPWQLYNPFVDWRSGYWQLWIASIFEYLVVSIGTMQELISDAYAIVFISLFRGHLAILRSRIENLRQDPKLSEKENYDQLVACIQDHRIIIQCSQIIRPILSITIFAQFMLVGIDLGLAAISILFFPSTIWTIMANVSFILAICMESFPCCMLCEHLIEDCARVSDSLFHSNWLTADRRYKSTVIYFLHRVQQPIQFTAGAIFPISVQSNIAVAKFAFSIITIVNQMNLGEKFLNDKANGGEQEP